MRNIYFPSQNSTHESWMNACAHFFSFLLQHYFSPTHLKNKGWLSIDYTDLTQFQAPSFKYGELMTGVQIKVLCFLHFGLVFCSSLPHKKDHIGYWVWLIKMTLLIIKKKQIPTSIFRESNTILVVKIITSTLLIFIERVDNINSTTATNIVLVSILLSLNITRIALRWYWIVNITRHYQPQWVKIFFIYVLLHFYNLESYRHANFWKM